MTPGILKKSALIFLLGMVALILQGAILKGIFPRLPVPNFIMILVVFLAFYEATSFGTVMAFMLGLFVDLGSGLLLGPQAGASVVVFGFLASLSQRIFVESPLAVMLAVGCSSLVGHFVYVVLMMEFHADQTFSLWQIFTWSFFGEAVLSAVLAPLVFKVVKFWYVKESPSLKSNRLVARI